MKKKTNELIKRKKEGFQCRRIKYKTPQLPISITRIHTIKIRVQIADNQDDQLIISWSQMTKIPKRRKNNQAMSTFWPAGVFAMNLS